MLKKCILMFLAFLAITGAVHGAAPSETIPDNAVCLLVVKIKSTDPGIAWILNAYKKWFMREKFGREVNSVVEDFNVLEFDEIAAGLLLSESGKPQYLAIGDMTKDNATVTFKYKDMNLKLKIKEREDVKGLQQGIVKALMDQWMDDKEKNEDTDGIVFSRKRAQKGDISAYTFVNNRVILGSDVGLVKAAKRESEGTVNRPAQKDILVQFLTYLDQDNDGYLFIDNKTGYLTNFARKKEALWHIPVLISGDVIDSLGIAFNIIDSNSAAAQAVFQARDASKLDLIESDARFMAEFSRRKLMQEKIDCVYDIETKGTAVVVNFKLNNIEPCIKTLLKLDTKDEQERKGAVVGVE